MTRAFSLAYLTAAPLDPVAMVELAARTGYRHVGLRLAPAMPGGDYAPLIDSRALRCETIGAMRATGVSVFDAEIVRLGPDFTPAPILPFLETCAELGARAILVAGDDRDPARLAASFAAFCAASAAFGLTADLEFMPWTAVPDCAAARRIVEAAGAANGRILVDALHAARSATSLADLRALPAGMLSYAQLCDAPAETPATDEGLIHTARFARLLPGDGGIDLAGIFAALPPELPISLEVPNQDLKRKHGVPAWVDLCRRSAEAVLDRLPPGRHPAPAAMR
jgi:sugar phosphate isomerase/epimerase